MEKFINMAKKELVQMHQEKRFQTLKEAATWAHDHVLAHRPVSHWLSGTTGGIGDSLSGGQALVYQ